MAKLECLLWYDANLIPILFKKLWATERQRQITEVPKYTHLRLALRMKSSQIAWAKDIFFHVFLEKQ